MFVLTFLSGYWPRFIKDPKLINLVGVLGGGFLMGSAFLIVLPEAIDSLFHGNKEGFSEKTTFTIGITILLGFYSMQMVNELFCHIALEMQRTKENLTSYYSDCDDGFKQHAVPLFQPCSS
jgi:hypothetical protein